ncbi:orotidine 5'-phosphate decarboxylase [Vermiphilus pyriformis]|nr:MAG: orotidine 5'-phosphate decarboxylase [Vermiphilus pyriformis]
MKLQIAFDITDLERALDIAHKVSEYTNIIEIGTPLLYTHGIKAVEKFRNAFPKKALLADTKIIDRSKETITAFAHAGADWMTVMAGTSKNVIHTACTVASSLNKKIMLDLLDAGSLGQSAMEAKNLGVDALLFHEPYDEQESLLLLDKWEMVRGNTTLPIFVSAKIKRETINSIISIHPDGIVIGRAIVEADNPVQEAEYFYNLINQDGTKQV